jgi:hypothetical protein
VLGRVTVSVDGRVAAASPLVAARSVGAATTFDKMTSTVKNPFVLLGLVAIVILVGLLLVRRGRGRNEPEEVNSRPRKDRRQVPQQRTPEERRRMHEERMRRRRQRLEREEGTG